MGWFCRKCDNNNAVTTPEGKLLFERILVHINEPIVVTHERVGRLHNVPVYNFNQLLSVIHDDFYHEYTVYWNGIMVHEYKDSSTEGRIIGNKIKEYEENKLKNSMEGF